MKNDPCGIDSRSFHISWGEVQRLIDLGRAHRAWAALRASFRRSSGDRVPMRALPPLRPPLRPRATAAGFLPGKLSSASCSIRSMTRRAIWFASLTLRNRRTFPLPERFGMLPMEPQSWKGGKGGRSWEARDLHLQEGHIPKVHFDTNHHLIVEWNPDDLLKTAAKLKNTIRATLPAEAKLDDDERDEM